MQVKKKTARNQQHVHVPIQHQSDKRAAINVLEGVQSQ